MNHKGKRLFITGIPTSGKSYLAKRLAKEIGGIAVNLDDLRESLSTDERYKNWVNFYLDKDEKEYLTKTTAENQWRNLVAQSGALWPVFKKEIEKYSEEKKPVIFECVNLLPHIIRKSFDFPCIVLIGSSFEEVLERNMKDPRWGNTKELQKLEAETFFEVERPKYRSEAEKHGCMIFESADVAFPIAKDLLS